MTLKLPEPLPYEFIDEFIESEVYFEDHGPIGGLKYHSAFRHGTRERSNTPSRMISLKLDDEYGGDYPEHDVEGYVRWDNSGYTWTAEEWTEAELDDWMVHGSIHLLRRQRQHRKNAKLKQEALELDVRLV